MIYECKIVIRLRMLFLQKQIKMRMSLIQRSGNPQSCLCQVWRVTFQSMLFTSRFLFVNKYCQPIDISIISASELLFSDCNSNEEITQLIQIPWIHKHMMYLYIYLYYLLIVHIYLYTFIVNIFGHLYNFHHSTR